MSREALALDISRVVSRVVSGERVDTAERGALLAAKYPELGMSGQMIREAIDRAAGMVGMIRSAPAPAVRPARENEAVRTEPPARPAMLPTNGDRRDPVAKPSNGALPVIAQSIDDELASSIDAEISHLVSGQAATPRATNGEAHSVASEPKGSGLLRTGAVAALRRVLFRN